MEKFIRSGTLMAVALWLPLIMMHAHVPVAHADTIADTLEEEDRQRCKQMSAEEEEAWQTIIDLLEGDEVDTEGMRDHLDQQVLPSQEQLQTEMALEEYAICLVHEDRSYLSVKTNMYMEVLTATDHLQEEEGSLAIEAFNFEYDGDHGVRYMETVFRNGRSVTAEIHYTSGFLPFRWRQKITRAEFTPDWIVFTQKAIIEPFSQIIENPLTKSAASYANHMEEEKTEEQEKEMMTTSWVANGLNAEVILTVGDEGMLKKPYSSHKMIPTDLTFDVLQRWEKAYEDDDAIIFPAESIRDRDWESVRKSRDDFYGEIRGDEEGEDIFHEIFR